MDFEMPTPLMRQYLFDHLLLNRVHQIDALELCALLPDQSVDMILADLPYGTTACSWDTVIPFVPMWEAFKRVIKPRGAIVLFAGQPFTSLLIASNVEMFKYTLVWEKSVAANFFNAKNKPLSLHEDVCVFSLGTTANGSQRQMNYYPQGLTKVRYPMESPQKVPDRTWFRSSIPYA